MWEALPKKAGIHSHICQQVSLHVGLISLPKNKPKIGPGPSKTRFGAPQTLQNRALGPPKSSREASKTPFLKDIQLKRALGRPRPSGLEANLAPIPCAAPVPPRCRLVMHSRQRVPAGISCSNYCTMSESLAKNAFCNCVRYVPESRKHRKNFGFVE